MLKKMLLVLMVLFVTSDMCHAITAQNTAPVAVASTAAASTEGEDLIGFLSVSGEWPSSSPRQGFYSFNSTDGVGTLLGDITPGNGLWSYM
ncbi:MAG: hypothetical protein ACI31C_00055, partial [Muribaculaceae bacterium]